MRGRGIDTVALDHITSHHNPKAVLSDDLAVLADPGDCVRTYGTRSELPHRLGLPELHCLRVGVPHRAQRPEYRAGRVRMAKVFRGPDGWKLQAIGEGIQAKHAGEAAPKLPRFLHL